MEKKKLEELLESLFRPVLEEKAVELVDLEFKREGRTHYLRVFIDKPGGVTLDDCSRVNQCLGEVLDLEDPISQSYCLEVSSPGLERPLKKDKDYTRFTGRKIKVKTYEPMDGQKVFKGILLGYQEGIVRLGQEGKEIGIPVDKISRANLVFEF